MAFGRRRGPGLVGMAARTAVVAGTATAVSGRTARRQQQKYATQDAQAQQEAAPMEQAPSEGGVDDTTAQLEQLAKLKQEGILTEEEFTAKKKQILGI
jgi:Short C-terminal domain